MLPLGQVSPIGSRPEIQQWCERVGGAGQRRHDGDAIDTLGSEASEGVGYLFCCTRETLKPRKPAGKA